MHILNYLEQEDIEKIKKDQGQNLFDLIREEKITNLHYTLRTKLYKQIKQFDKIFKDFKVSLSEGKRSIIFYKGVEELCELRVYISDEAECKLDRMSVVEYKGMLKLGKSERMSLIEGNMVLRSEKCEGTRRIDLYHKMTNDLEESYKWIVQTLKKYYNFRIDIDVTTPQSISFILSEE